MTVIAVLYNVIYILSIHLSPVTNSDKQNRGAGSFVYIRRLRSSKRDAFNLWRMPLLATIHAIVGPFHSANHIDQSTCPSMNDVSDSTATWLYNTKQQRGTVLDGARFRPQRAQNA